MIYTPVNNQSQCLFLPSKLFCFSRSVLLMCSNRENGANSSVVHFLLHSDGVSSNTCMLVLCSFGQLDSGFVVD